MIYFNIYYSFIAGKNKLQVCLVCWTWHIQSRSAEVLMGQTGGKHLTLQEVQQQLQAEFMYTLIEALWWKISDIGGRTKNNTILFYMTIILWVWSSVTLQEYFSLVLNNPALSKQAALKSAILAQMCKFWASYLLENPSISCFRN